MSQDKSETPRHLKFALVEFSQLASTFIFAATLLCYIFGLLIVNLHLANYGVYSTEFIRTEYVLVGATFVLLIVVAGFSTEFGLKSIQQSKIRWREKNKSRAALFLLIGLLETLIPIIFILLVLSRYQFNADSNDFWASIIFLIIISILIRESVTGVFELLRKVSTSELAISHEKDLKFVNDRLASVPFILICLILYSKFTFPNISAAIGGGMKEPVILIATPRGTQVSIEAGLPVLKNGTSVGPLLLLTETETELVVLTKENSTDKFHAVKLSKPLFDAVIIPSNKTKKI